MEIAILLLEAVILALIIVLMVKSKSSGDKAALNEIMRLSKEMQDRYDAERRQNHAEISELKRDLVTVMNNNTLYLGEQLTNSQKSASQSQSQLISEQLAAQKTQLDTINKSWSEQLRVMQESITNQLKQFESRFSSIDTGMENKLQNIRTTIETQLGAIREDNAKHLDKIRGTVDEKLQKTLESKMNESFKLVSERLEQVYKGLGEMQNVAKGVGDLKKVLSNVKTRGILGEVQLGALLKEILTPDQYDENVVTVPKSTNRVEFAVKLPGPDDGTTVYLPIDSKFNGDTFTHLQDAYEAGDKALIDQCRKDLADAIRKCAKDISSKYVSPPHTTQFAVMFLPVEGLYAEVVNMRGFVEELQHDYKINVAGPSTMAAMLNSLRMGFQTLAVQKRSSEVWNVLAEVRNEFEKFEGALQSTQKKLRSTEDELEKLIGTRTRQMNKALGRFDRLEASAETRPALTE